MASSKASGISEDGEKTHIRGIVSVGYYRKHQSRCDGRVAVSAIGENNAGAYRHWIRVACGADVDCDAGGNGGTCECTHRHASMAMHWAMQFQHSFMISLLAVSVPGCTYMLMRCGIEVNNGPTVISAILLCVCCACQLQELAPKAVPYNQEQDHCDVQ